MTNTLAYWTRSYVTKKMKCANIGTMYILDWKGLLVKNTLAYWEHL